MVSDINLKESVSLKWKKYNSDYEDKEKMLKINNYSKTFNKSYVENTSIKNVKYIRFSFKNYDKDNDEQIMYKLMKAERIVKINNYLSTEFLPEIVDIYYKKKSDKQKIYIVKEYVKGIYGTVNFLECITNQVDVIYDDFGNSKYLRSRRVIDQILDKIIDFEEYLYSKNLTYVGIHPSHFILGIDSIIKFCGESYILKHKDGYIDDPLYVDPSKFGNLIISRYTPPELVEYIESGGKIKVSVFGVISYQLGVLLFDLATLGLFLRNEIKKDKIMSAKIYSRSYLVGQKIRESILQLIDDEFRTNIKDFNTIRQVLQEVIKPF
ncbi:hypothetical protein [Fervidobacterium sp. 2310opik-2]|uniref:hypothetical protein n=1 Tax=Fervidobacterium sp. 2310opik-2 TaxID=1755815 RepID=UPI0013DF1D70|nr:hypothetical protein [Fervidobacterium sp. 2310opik-2]KAF2961065.1 hypothetical protein AS161_03560 [Fervidobacterium sp. 2310opik-2]